MSERRFDPEDAAALEREIEDLLAVEPPPEFAARVRTRVAEGSAPRLDIRPAWWGVMGGAGLVAAGVALAMLLNSSPSPDGRTSGRTDGVARSSPAPETGGGGDVAVPVDSPVSLPQPQESRVAANRAAAGPSAADVRIARDPFADVMVSAYELAGLRQALAMVQAGIEIVPAPEDQAAAGAEEMPDIVIDPIAIEPIVLARMEGVAE